MKKKVNIVITTIFSILLLIGFTSSVNSVAQMPGAPVVRKINQDGLYYNKPSISGLTNKNTDVLVYIDDVLNGLATVKVGKTPTDSFNFRVQNKLKAGKHKMILVAKSKSTKILSAPTKEYFFSVKGVATPVVYQPNESFITGHPYQPITGWSEYSSTVFVYIDGRYDGKVKLGGGETRFKYIPKSALSVGKHSVYVVAEDVHKEKSQASEIKKFTIEKAFLAPTVFKVKFSAKNLPVVTGLVRNNSTIRVYLDGKVIAQYLVRKTNGKNVSFAYTINKKLYKGSHKVVVDAIDARGKVSAPSKAQYFTTYQGVVKKKSVASSATQKTVAKAPKKVAAARVVPEVVKEEVKTEELKAVEEKKEEPIVEEKQVEDDFTKELLGALNKADETGSTSGTSSETGKSSSVRTNTIIFVFFLVAVIAWIFWVNRELIKERNKTAEEDEMDDETKS